MRSTAQTLAPVKMKRLPFHTSIPIPVTVQVAFWVLMAELAYGVLYQVMTLRWSKLIQSFEGGWARREPLIAMPAGYGVGWAVAYIVFILAVFAFWLWATLGIRRGFRWAQILATISAALGLITTIRGVDVVTIAHSIVDVGAVLLLWVRPSNAFFAAVSVERKSYRLARLA